VRGVGGRGGHCFDVENEGEVRGVAGVMRLFMVALVCDAAVKENDEEREGVWVRCCGVGYGLALTGLLVRVRAWVGVCRHDQQPEPRHGRVLHGVRGRVERVLRRLRRGPDALLSGLLDALSRHPSPA
jgi:hypothetical protein